MTDYTMRSRRSRAVVVPTAAALAISLAAAGSASLLAAEEPVDVPVAQVRDYLDMRLDEIAAQHLHDDTIEAYRCRDHEMQPGQDHPLPYLPDVRVPAFAGLIINEVLPPGEERDRLIDDAFDYRLADRDYVHDSSPEGAHKVYIETTLMTVVEPSGARALAERIMGPGTEGIPDSMLQDLLGITFAGMLDDRQILLVAEVSSQDEGLCLYSLRTRTADEFMKDIGDEVGGDDAEVSMGGAAEVAPAASPSGEDDASTVDEASESG